MLDKLFQLNIDPKKRDRITFKAFVWLLFKISFTYELLRERCIEKKVQKKLTSVSFMYVCVAENVELLVAHLSRPWSIG